MQCLDAQVQALLGRPGREAWSRSAAIRKSPLRRKTEDRSHAQRRAGSISDASRARPKRRLPVWMPSFPKRASHMSRRKTSAIACGRSSCSMSASTRPAAPLAQATAMCMQMRPRSSGARSSLPCAKSWRSPRQKGSRSRRRLFYAYAALERTLDPASTPSMGQDRINRHRTEVDEFSGEVLRRAEKQGILVPANAFQSKRIREIEASCL